MNERDNQLHAAVTELLESTHCRKHGMEWEVCCLADAVLEIHGKVMLLLTTARKEEREAVLKEAEVAIQTASLIGARYCSIDFLNGAHWGIQRAIETVQGIVSPGSSGSDKKVKRKYMYEDELPENMPQADYDEWYKRSFVPDRIGCRVGPRYP